MAGRDGTFDPGQGLIGGAPTAPPLPQSVVQPRSKTVAPQSGMEKSLGDMANVVHPLKGTYHKNTKRTAL